MVDILGQVWGIGNVFLDVRVLVIQDVDSMFWFFMDFLDGNFIFFVIVCEKMVLKCVLKEFWCVVMNIMERMIVLFLFIDQMGIQLIFIVVKELSYFFKFKDYMV